MDLLSTKMPPSTASVVRLTTSYWSDTRGLYVKRSLRYLRKLSRGIHILEEDANAIGADEVMPRIINLEECPDGVYLIVICDEYRDEIGVLEDYDYTLIPFDGKDLLVDSGE